MYQFERDTKGNISQEIGFDGLTKMYERSQAGLVQKIQRPGERWTAYEHAPLEMSFGLIIMMIRGKRSVMTKWIVSRE